jgi:hypothetical protein
MSIRVKVDEDLPRAIQFSFLTPFRKGGWGDFGTLRTGKSPLAPLCKGGNGAHRRKLNDPGTCPDRWPTCSLSAVTML